MITKHEVIPLFLEACPSFAPRWQEHCAEWDEEHLLYVDLGKLVHHIVDQFAAGRTEEFPAIFAVCERLHLEAWPKSPHWPSNKRGGDYPHDDETIPW